MAEQEYIDIMTVLNEIRAAVKERYKAYKDNYVAAGGEEKRLIPLVTIIPEYNAETAEADICEWIEGTNMAYMHPFAHVVCQAPVTLQQAPTDAPKLQLIVDGVKHMAQQTNAMLRKMRREECVYRLSINATPLGIKHQLEEILRLIKTL